MVTFLPVYTKLEVVCQLCHNLLGEMPRNYLSFYVAFQQLFAARCLVIRRIRQHSYIPCVSSVSSSISRYYLLES